MHALSVQARYRRLGPWAGFPEGLTSTYMLDPSDPLFTDIGAAFVQACASYKRISSLLEQCNILQAYMCDVRLAAATVLYVICT
jgi:hypothetical protein